jgi:hypothetical protein
MSWRWVSSCHFRRRASVQTEERRAKMARWLWPCVAVGVSVYAEVVLVLVMLEMVESEGRGKAWVCCSASACACMVWLAKLFELGGVRV